MLSKVGKYVAVSEISIICCYEYLYCIYSIWVQHNKNLGLLPRTTSLLTNLTMAIGEGAFVSRIRFNGGGANTLVTPSFSVSQPFKLLSSVDGFTLIRAPL